MARQQRFDVQFRLSTNKTYYFMLAMIDGRKGWYRRRLHSPPPSMIKSQIDIVITAQEDETMRSGGRQQRRMDEIMDQLDKIVAETGIITVTGIDGVKRLVLVDVKGYTTETVLDEKDTEPEYRAAMTLWERYPAA